MCIKLHSRELNIGPYPLHLTSNYTCGVIIAPRVCSSDVDNLVYLTMGGSFGSKKKKKKTLWEGSYVN